MSTAKLPFTQRFGVGLPSVPLYNDVPASARIGLINILKSLCADRQFMDWDTLATEALYVARQESDDFMQGSESVAKAIIKEMEWPKFYVFCERVYQKLHGAPERDDYGNWAGNGPAKEAQEYFTDEINQLLAEENLDYHFVDGAFERRGRPQTQKNLQRVGTVLSQERFAPVRKHYAKAQDFFNKRPEPDVENCVKEALCALEATAEVLFGRDAARGFDSTLRANQGNAEGQIPPAFVEGMIKLRAFRGNAQGVAHAALQGGTVTDVDAEFVLSITATYITYLNDKFPDFWTIPF